MFLSLFLPHSSFQTKSWHNEVMWELRICLVWIYSWMLEMHHKQAEIVVSRVLSEKLLLKNKTLANEYKKLKVFKSAPSLTHALKFVIAPLFLLSLVNQLFSRAWINSEQVLNTHSLYAEEPACNCYALQADHAGKRKQLQLLEEELKQLTELQSCTESETEDFDEVKQFQALLACANANDELPQNQA
jgi:hypothetical protein